ncbi:MAG TPA: hypothetical protein VJI15_03095 [Candidatus Nanoarchaeia archaeon]|nr:hypothetical protein [Candidatus Nanoarchaeia archaeon]
MNLIEEAHQRLFPGKEFSYQTAMEYNRRLSDFNANIKLHQQTIQVNLNLQWKDIDDEIKIGLIQHLLIKVLKVKKRSSTPNIELYNNFIRQIPVLMPKTKSDPDLEKSFHRVNQAFFSSSLVRPNLQWGVDSKRKLASYNFHDDSVTMSTVFKEARQEVLDYLMYHELLHKHHQFKHNNGRSSFHSKAFREDEHRYPNHQQIEQEITKMVRKRKKESFLQGIFERL